MYRHHFLGGHHRVHRDHLHHTVVNRRLRRHGNATQRARICGRWLLRSRLLGYRARNAVHFERAIHVERMLRLHGPASLRGLISLVLVDADRTAAVLCGRWPGRALCRRSWYCGPMRQWIVGGRETHIHHRLRLVRCWAIPTGPRHTFVHRVPRWQVRQCVRE